MKPTTAFPLLSIFCTLILINLPSIAQEDPLRILVIGAHPDDADIDAGGTAALWASMGHQVKFLSSDQWRCRTPIHGRGGLGQAPSSRSAGICS